MAAVKKEPGGKVKQEPGTKQGGSKVGFARTALDHYVNQVGFINSVMPPPWKCCFGGLGSGIVGVRPAHDAPATAAAAPAAPEAPAAALAVGEEPEPAAAPWLGPIDLVAEGPIDLVAEPAADGDVPVKTEPVKMEVEEGEAAPAGEEDGSSTKLTHDTVVVLLVASPAAPSMMRGGKKMGGYKDCLDVDLRTLHWRSQRRDRGKLIMSIVGHQRRGGRVVVGVREGVGVEGGQEYKLLGEVSRVDGVRTSSFLVAEGDEVLREEGTTTYHKYITAACLNDGLRSGIGLAAVRFPFKSDAQGSKAKWCAKCCYEVASCTLHFDELCPAGVAAHQRPYRRPITLMPLKRRRAKMELKVEVKEEPSERPTKRCRGKQPRVKGEVKDEPLEASSASAASMWAALVASTAAARGEMPADEAATSPLPEEAPAGGGGSAEAPAAEAPAAQAEPKTGTLAALFKAQANAGHSADEPAQAPFLPSAVSVKLELIDAD